jgi:hydroxymethylpyrimidine pyrophosphatase-like HAD family hydrolase
MVIAVDFDGTIVSQDRDYNDLTTPLELLPHAKEALRSFKRAGHLVLLYSARASRALLEDPQLDPLVRAGKKKVNMNAWEKQRSLHRARYQQMIDFVEENLRDEIDAIDDGRQGKPQAAVFIDDRALRYGMTMGGHTWKWLIEKYGMEDSENGE